jgi:asparagine synthase (glutamine-hydrolysing)
MAWGLEARVPFLDKAFLEVAMNVDAKEKMFSKGEDQEIDEDGKPRMEKVKYLCNVVYRVAIANCHAYAQYILRKAFDCSPNGKVVSVPIVCGVIHSSFP